MLKVIFELKKERGMRNRVVKLMTLLVLMGLGMPQQGNADLYGIPLIEKNGLSWISPILNQNISYSDMANRLSNVSSEYYGFRLATTNEVLDLIDSYFCPYSNFTARISASKNQIINSGYTSLVYGPTVRGLDSFFNQFGWNEANPAPQYRRYVGGYSWEPITEKLIITNLHEYDIYGTAPPLGSPSGGDPSGYEMLISARYPSESWYEPLLGTWLVKPIPVPVPGAALLLGSGLLGLAGLRRKKAAVA